MDLTLLLLSIASVVTTVVTVCLLVMVLRRLGRHRRELNELRTTGRAEVSEKIRVARGFGDLSENSEYDEAKNDQAVMEARIAQLEEQLKHVEIIEAEDIATDMVSVGSVVKILDIEYGDEMTYRIVSSLEIVSIFWAEGTTRGSAV